MRGPSGGGHASDFAAQEPHPDAARRFEQPRRGGRLPLGWAVALIAAAAALLYFGSPPLAGLDDAWRRLSAGDPLLLGAAALLECASYVRLHRTVRDWDEGEITQSM